MAQYTAKDLRNITKDELVELLKKEGIEFDEKMSYFALRALLLNETKNDDSMARKKEVAVDENTVETVEKVNEQTETTEQSVEQIETETVKNETEPETKPKTETKKPNNPINKIDALTALRSEVVKRRGGVGLGKSAFAAELAKRRGERVTGVTFAQELKSRQLKYGK